MDNENTVLKHDDETIDYLFKGFLKVLQKEKGYRARSHKELSP